MKKKINYILDLACPNPDNRGDEWDSYEVKLLIDGEIRGTRDECLPWYWTPATATDQGAIIMRVGERCDARVEL